MLGWNQTWLGYMQGACNSGLAQWTIALAPEHWTFWRPHQALGQPRCLTSCSTCRENWAIWQMGPTVTFSLVREKWWRKVPGTQASSTECKMSREMTNARGIQNTKEQIFLETLMRALPPIHCPVPGMAPTSARWWGGHARCCRMSRQEGAMPSWAHGTLLMPPGTCWGCWRREWVQRGFQAQGTFLGFVAPTP